MYTIPDEDRLILESRQHDPFAVLGRQPLAKGDRIKVFRPGAAQVSIQTDSGPLVMERLYNSDLFCWQGNADIPVHYQLLWDDGLGNQHQGHDPYSFEPIISDFDLHLFAEGRHQKAFGFLGSRPYTIDGITGVLFATWGPNAERISVVGDFNRWDGRCHPMRCRGGSGVWELFIPELQPGTLYKFEIRSRDSGHVFLKADPYARAFELRPSTAAIVAGDDHYDWQDQDWLKARAEADWLHKPMSIYEVHLGSWQKDDQGHFLNYRELARRMVGYVQEMGFTHIELLPITEHPLDASWGYQTTGYFAPTSRFGSPDDLRYFIDQCHQNNIGVILDWVPAHFPRDEHALARFDGTQLYEYQDPRRGEHRDWGTLIFNYGRNEVRSFLISSACYWLEVLHIDGLRVDAVASMLYLDYSREAHDWLPNVHGGREHLEAIDFIRELNTIVHQAYPGALTMAEESTSWPMVSRPTDQGGLGFSMKWNMGWMNDNLDYFHHDPIHRQYHHNQLTFGLLYAFTENFILPFSHDEVVHMKRSMLYKMPGDEWQQFANLRLLYTYMYTMPGKKLLFMGNEFGQGPEWNHNKALDWYVLDYPNHKGLQRLVADLNRVYRDYKGLHVYDFDGAGFEWIECNDAGNSLMVFQRQSEHEYVVVALNFTPVPHETYRIGVPLPGHYDVLINSDSMYYGGSNMGNDGSVASQPMPWMGREHSVLINLPPLAGVVLHHVKA